VGKKGSLLTIQRKWTPGEHVRVRFDMPVQVLAGGISYPHAVAIKRGPQVLAVDKGINGIDSSARVTYAGRALLTDAAAALPKEWDWKEAFYVMAGVNGVQRRIVVVPFAEAGQSAADIAVWISNPK
jgi:DUF1680 family protein